MAEIHFRSFVYCGGTTSGIVVVGSIFGILFVEITVVLRLVVVCQLSENLSNLQILELLQM